MKQDKLLPRSNVHIELQNWRRQFQTENIVMMAQEQKNNSITKIMNADYQDFYLKSKITLTLSPVISADLWVKTFVFRFS